MTKEEIDLLIATTRKKEDGVVSLIETHISWVIRTYSLVYKIKKPMAYSFLDYSTRDKRRYYCYKELILNRRITHDVYLEVVPIFCEKGLYYIDGKKGEVVDYAVKMRRLDEDKLMINLLKTKNVSEHQIMVLAKKIADFHHQSVIISDAFAWRSFDEKFADIVGVRQFLTEHIGNESGSVIDMALEKSTQFLRQNIALINDRVRAGFQRDVHGDLHAKNIFLYHDPVLFDCIEFNDGYRQMDVLNEVAFCCMDLEANQRHDISQLLLNQYLKAFPAIRNEGEKRLFSYFKAYRANVRAKVSALRAMQKTDDSEYRKNLVAAEKYLRLMVSYLQEI